MTTAMMVRAEELSRIRDWLRGARDNPHAHRANLQQRAGFAGALKKWRARRERRAG